MQELSTTNLEIEMKEITNHELNEINGGCLICWIVEHYLHGF